jgi:HECT-domain (ubiquitin-transferase)
LCHLFSLVPLQGFYDVVPEPLLAVFDFQEVELLFHGLPNIDMDDWMRNTEYTGEFNGQANHKVILHTISVAVNEAFHSVF